MESSLLQSLLLEIRAEQHASSARAQEMMQSIQALTERVDSLHAKVDQLTQQLGTAPAAGSTMEPLPFSLLPDVDEPVLLPASTPAVAAAVAAADAQYEGGQAAGSTGASVQAQLGDGDTNNGITQYSLRTSLCLVCSAVCDPPPTACSRCRVVTYCGVPCQDKDWREGDHKSICRVLKAHPGQTLWQAWLASFHEQHEQHARWGQAPHELWSEEQWDADSAVQTRQITCAQELTTLIISAVDRASPPSVAFQKWLYCLGEMRARSRSSSSQSPAGVAGWATLSPPLVLRLPRSVQVPAAAPTCSSAAATADIPVEASGLDVQRQTAPLETSECSAKGGGITLPEEEAAVPLVQLQASELVESRVYVLVTLEAAPSAAALSSSPPVCPPSAPVALVASLEEALTACKYYADKGHRSTALRKQLVRESGSKLTDASRAALWAAVGPVLCRYLATSCAEGLKQGIARLAGSSPTMQTAVADILKQRRLKLWSPPFVTSEEDYAAIQSCKPAGSPPVPRLTLQVDLSPGLEAQLKAESCLPKAVLVYVLQQAFMLVFSGTVMFTYTEAEGGGDRVGPGAAAGHWDPLPRIEGEGLSECLDLGLRFHPHDMDMTYMTDLLSASQTCRRLSSSMFVTRHTWALGIVTSRTAIASVTPEARTSLVKNMQALLLQRFGDDRKDDFPLVEVQARCDTDTLYLCVFLVLCRHWPLIQTEVPPHLQAVAPLQGGITFIHRALEGTGYDGSKWSCITSLSELCIATALYELLHGWARDWFFLTWTGEGQPPLDNWMALEDELVAAWQTVTADARRALRLPAIADAAVTVPPSSFSLALGPLLTDTGYRHILAHSSGEKAAHKVSVSVAGDESSSGALPAEIVLVPHHDAASLPFSLEDWNQAVAAVALTQEAHAFSLGSFAHHVCWASHRCDTAHALLPLIEWSSKPGVLSTASLEKLHDSVAWHIRCYIAAYVIPAADAFATLARRDGWADRAVKALLLDLSHVGDGSAPGRVGVHCSHFTFLNLRQPSETVQGADSPAPLHTSAAAPQSQVVTEGKLPLLATTAVLAVLSKYAALLRLLVEHDWTQPLLLDAHALAALAWSAKLCCIQQLWMKDVTGPQHLPYLLPALDAIEASLACPHSHKVPQLKNFAGWHDALRPVLEGLCAPYIVCPLVTRSPYHFRFQAGSVLPPITAALFTLSRIHALRAAGDTTMGSVRDTILHAQPVGTFPEVFSALVHALCAFVLRLPTDFLDSLGSVTGLERVAQLHLLMRAFTPLLPSLHCLLAIAAAPGGLNEVCSQWEEAVYMVGLLPVAMPEPPVLGAGQGLCQPEAPAAEHIPSVGLFDLPPSTFLGLPVEPMWEPIAPAVGRPYFPPVDDVAGCTQPCVYAWKAFTDAFLLLDFATETEKEAMIKPYLPTGSTARSEDAARVPLPATAAGKGRQGAITEDNIPEKANIAMHVGLRYVPVALEQIFKKRVAVLTALRDRLAALQASPRPESAPEFERFTLLTLQEDMVVALSKAAMNAGVAPGVLIVFTRWAVQLCAELLYFFTCGPFSPCAYAVSAETLIRGKHAWYVLRMAGLGPEHVKALALLRGSDPACACRVYSMFSYAVAPSSRRGASGTGAVLPVAEDEAFGEDAIETLQLLVSSDTRNEFYIALVVLLRRLFDAEPENSIAAIVGGHLQKTRADFSLAFLVLAFRFGAPWATRRQRLILGYLKEQDYLVQHALRRFSDAFAFLKPVLHVLCGTPMPLSLQDLGLHASSKGIAAGHEAGNCWFETPLHRAWASSLPGEMADYTVPSEPAQQTVQKRMQAFSAGEMSGIVASISAPVLQSLQLVQLAHADGLDSGAMLRELQDEIRASVRTCAMCRQKPYKSFCTKCRITGYCGRECQAADWKGLHKTECGLLRTERVCSAFLALKQHIVDRLPLSDSVLLQALVGLPDEILLDVVPSFGTVDDPDTIYSASGGLATVLHDIRKLEHAARHAKAMDAPGAEAAATLQPVIVSPAGSMGQVGQTPSSSSASAAAASAELAALQEEAPDAAVQPTAPPSTPAVEPSPVNKPPTLGTRMIDHFTEHPWHFFGPLLAFFIGWVVRNNLSSNEQDAAVRDIDGRSPLHPREVTSLGRDNALTLAQYKAVAQKVFALLRERQAGLAPGEALLMRPSELHAVIAHVLAEGQVSAPPSASSSSSAVAQTAPPAVWQPRHAYMLSRVGSWRDAVLGGQEKPLGHGLPRPASWRTDSSSSSSPASAAGDKDKETSHMTLESLTSHASASYPQSDEPMHPLSLLVLYTSCIGGRAEPAAAPATADAAAQAQATAIIEDESGPASPSQRLALCVGLVRAWADLVHRRELPPHAHTQHAAPLSADLFAAPYSIPELVATLDVLGDTHQIPTRQRLRPGPSAWPWKTYGLASPLLLLAEGCRDAALKLEEIRKTEHRFDDGRVLDLPLPPRTYCAIGLPAPPSPPKPDREAGQERWDKSKGLDLLLPPLASGSSATLTLRDTAGKDISDLCAALAKHAGIAQLGQGLHEGNRVLLLDAAQARKAVLISRSVCAWGECYSVER